MDVGGYANPQLVDLNGDGLIDVISGDYDGSVIFLQNTVTRTHCGSISVQIGMLIQHALAVRYGRGTAPVLCSLSVMEPTTPYMV